MRKFYKKYKDWFVCVLAFFLCCKSCQSCHRANQIEWNQIQTEQQLDSIDSVLTCYKINNDAMQDTITLYKSALNHVELEKDMLKKNNETLIKSNRYIRNKQQ